MNGNQRIHPNNGSYHNQPPAASKTWADLFRSGSSDEASGPSSSIQKFAAGDSKLTCQTIVQEPNDKLKEILNKLKDQKLKHSLPLLIPCDQSNGCYFSAPLLSAVL